MAVNLRCNLCPTANVLKYFLNLCSHPRFCICRRVHVIPVEGESLHLKSVVSALAKDVLVVADNEPGRAVFRYIQGSSSPSGSYSPLFVPDMLCSNVVRVADSVLVQSGPKLGRSMEILSAKCAELGLRVLPVSMSETAKADGALTCCSVLFRKV